MEGSMTTQDAHSSVVAPPQDPVARQAGGKKEPAWRAFVRQYEDFMQVILLAAALVNQLVTQETGTTVVLAGLTVFNAVIGLRQEATAEESVKALSQMMKTIARVRRDGQAVEIDAEELVPGDVVLVEPGNRPLSWS
jgi:Ca2+-transporting ATPase